jgi:hypothetical protein
MLLATPVIATVRDITSYIYHKILGENPYPPEEEPQKPVELPPNQSQHWLNKLGHWQPIKKFAKPMLDLLHQRRKGDG